MGSLSAVLSGLPPVFQQKAVLNLFKFGLAKLVSFTCFHWFTSGKLLPVGNVFLTQNGLVVSGAKQAPNRQTHSESDSPSHASFQMLQ
jgi:hypothetical protein